GFRMPTAPRTAFERVHVAPVRGTAGQVCVRPDQPERVSRHPPAMTARAKSKATSTGCLHIPKIPRLVSPGRGRHFSTARGEGEGGGAYPLPGCESAGQAGESVTPGVGTAWRAYVCERKKARTPVRRGCGPSREAYGDPVSSRRNRRMWSSRRGVQL